MKFLPRFLKPGRVFKTKMKRLLYFILLILSIGARAQNLVPNPSFEIHSACPTGGQLYNASPWFQPLKYLGNNVTISCSTDYYDSCSTYWQTLVPNNLAGHQFARTGIDYVGFSMFYPVNNGLREYLETELTSSLIAGETYCIEFYVSLADTSRTAVSNFGAYFSNDSLVYDSTNAWRIPVTPQIINSPANIVTDKDNWVKISGSFVAQGGEKFITIGNFSDSSVVTYTNVPTSGAGAITDSYYFIDDISVFRCADTIPVIIENPNSFFIPNAFSPNGDGNNDILFVRGKNIQEINLSVYDRWGQRVFETHDINEGWDGTYNGEQMENAVFVYYLTVTYSDGKTEAKKGNVNLIR